MTQEYVRDHDGEPMEDSGAESKVRAPFNVLRELFGAPDDDAGDKVSTCWQVKGVAPAHGTFLLMDRYDEDEGIDREAFRAKPWYDWEVWGPGEEEVAAFCQWLSRKVVAALSAKPGARTLDPASRQKVNELIQAGVSPAEAIRQAGRFQAADDIHKRFRWPIESA